MVIKVLLVPVLMISGCIIAGAYGMIHNQISYIVSPDFYHQMLFMRMHIDPGLQNAWGASLVGLISTWWMGLIIGYILAPLGLIIPGLKAYIKTVLMSFIVTAVTALLVGAIALAGSYVFIDPANIEPITAYGQNVNDPVAYLRAGTMHNFSYLGGAIGMITGGVYIVMLNFRIRKQIKISEQSELSMPTPPNPTHHASPQT